MFKNKIVLITGGSSGIGKVTAIMFAQNHADVVITYKDNKKGAEDTIQQIQKLGQNAIAIKADLTKEKESQKVVDLTIKKFGKIDILVNNVGGSFDSDDWNENSKAWKKTFDLNLFSMMNVSKYAIKLFQKQQSGIIVNISSRFGLNGQYDVISYSAAKAGVVNITQAYAKLLSPFGRANSICPSAVRSGYWLRAPKKELEETLKIMPNHKLIEPKTIAQKILFLASDEAKDIKGQNFEITK